MSSDSPSLPPAPWQPLICFLSLCISHSGHFVGMGSHAVWTVVCVWLLSLSIMFLEFIYFVTRISSSPWIFWVFVDSQERVRN